jgi:hypothetical protein
MSIMGSRYPMGKIRMEKLQAAKMASQALRMVGDIIGKFGSRLTGSESCLKAADVLARELEPFCDRVERERFTVRPKAFLGWIRILVAYLSCRTAVRCGFPFRCFPWS